MLTFIKTALIDFPRKHKRECKDMTKHIPASRKLAMKSIFQSAYLVLMLCVLEGGKGHVTPLTTEVQWSWS